MRELIVPGIKKHQHCSFGDTWSFTNFYIALGKENTYAVKIYADSIERALMDKYLSLLDTDYKFEYTDKPSKLELYTTFSCFHNSYERRYLPTKIQHKPGPYKKICYGLEGFWAVEAKRPPDILNIVNSIPGYKFVDAGLPLTVEECVQELATCDLYVGIDSGVSHVARSVGVPMFLVEHNYSLQHSHPELSATYTKCLGTLDAINKMKKFLNE